jgi:hypothetical protein
MRPYPPLDLVDDPLPRFVPAPELRLWAKETFIDEDAELVNEDHEHLRQAEIGFVWTNVENVKRNRLVLGQCQLVSDSGEKWSAGRSVQQIREWFGWQPDFLITIYAPTAATMEHGDFMALLEHELYHAAQALDKEQQPRFNDETGAPVFAMRAHDVEEFVGVVERYGMTGANVARMVEAANRGPSIRQARISAVCGTCLRLVS